jgi:hypothetical protein
MIPSLFFYIFFIHFELCEPNYSIRELIADIDVVVGRQRVIGKKILQFCKTEYEKAKKYKRRCSIISSEKCSVKVIKVKYCSPNHKTYQTQV